MRFLKTGGLCPKLRARVNLAGSAIAAIFCGSFLFPARALAQDWSAPATSMLESLESGSVSLAAPVIGVGVIIYGIWAMVSGRIDIMRLAQLVVAGGIVIFGPTLLRTLLSAA